MKKLVLLPFFVFVLGGVSAQILDTNTIWSEAKRKLYYIKNDTTTIDTKVYHRIHSYISDTLFHYSGTETLYLIREENNRVFWRNQYLNKDNLLYDFGLDIGDSIYVKPNYYMAGDSTLLICEDIDTVVVMGYERRRMTMRTTAPSLYYGTDIEYWYSGIGSSLGLFSSGYLKFVFMDQINPKLYCCHKGFEQVYQNADNDLCYDIGVGLESIRSISFLEVYPNPTKGEVFIKTDGIINTVTLYDLYGKHLLINYDSFSRKIRFNSLEMGIYILKITIFNKEYIKMIIYE
ncbi:MAG: T9SS type A sorting domain-containing protein [Crocinitomicaceae bacterium]|nr:T9SS type A sorting domain-containing protein [Crocinitomicaceae bacterium]